MTATEAAQICAEKGLPMMLCTIEKLQVGQHLSAWDDWPPTIVVRQVTREEFIAWLNQVEPDHITPYAYYNFYEVIAD